MGFNIPRGTQDLLPGTIEKWQYVENHIKTLCSAYNYHEIRTPIFEHTDLFLRGVGESTDIVQKEMYTFKDKGDRSLTLRPEGTASVARAFVENKLFGLSQQPVKLFYIGPMFRYERPQSGRMRQLHQFGIEALGSEDPGIDAEVISLAFNTYKSLGLKKLKLVINSLGDWESRKRHRESLVAHFEPSIHEFCEDCQKRLELNPLRILDCKKDKEHPLVQSAPAILDFLSDESKAYFADVQKYLDANDIQYVIDPTLVRGLDYYNHTAFEIMSEAEGFGAVTTLSGGGRYNGMVKEIGGPETPCMGFGIGIERLLLALETEGVELPISKKLDCFVACLCEESKLEGSKLLQQLRQAGLSADRDYLDKKMKAQFKMADRLQAEFVVILGEEELNKGIAQVKNMETGEQAEVSLQEVVKYIQQRGAQA
ncbi:histidine--tRNA ligase [Aureibacillus halotolerans]|uniref:Histidine--tRNA ligase n=1 Tax=Aureibacillus halotolerans TaxID=1508390 RepID=A0A4V3D4Y1_9BACI|nr:histidine--tRNA ligase [Aureibacillus halotolerans]TDQ37997.1 histidyl-tRNA synthetase [Aureibacillus halotolerans]